jgi:hypothetical protein
MVAGRAAPAHHPPHRGARRRLNPRARELPAPDRAAYTRAGLTFNSPGYAMDVVDRAKKILLQPKSEWDVIAAETPTVQELFTKYVMILAAIPAVATFIGFSLIGFGGVRVPITYGIAHLVAGYALSLAYVYVLALVIENIAPSFDGQKDFSAAIKVAAYAPTAAWLAGVFYILPATSILGILGLYSFYLLFLGLPKLMKVPGEKALPYTAVVIIASIVTWIVVTALAALAIPGRVRGF